MFRKKTGIDMPDEEFEKITGSHNKMWHDYLDEFIIPECCAYFLATGYKTDSVWEASFDIHINTMLSRLNQDSSNENFEKYKKRIKKILKIKYGFIVVNENPLDFAPAYKNK